MSDIKNLLKWLEEAQEVSGSENVIFDMDEVQPVIFQPPKGGGGGKPGEVEYDKDVEGEVWTAPPEESETEQVEAPESPFEVKQIGEKPEKQEGEGKEGEGKEGEGKEGEGKEGEGKEGEGKEGEGKEGEGEPGKSKSKPGKGKPAAEKAGEAGEEGETGYEMNGKKLGSTTDSHDIFDKIGGEKLKEKMERSSKNIAQEIQKKAEQQRKRLKRSQSGKSGGPGGKDDGEGNFYEEVLNRVFKPKIDWTLLSGAINNHFVSIRPKMTAMSKSQVFKTELTKMKKTERRTGHKKLSYAKSITEPKNQLNRDYTGRGRKVLDPGEQHYIPETEVNIIVALDTSGSVSQKFIDIAVSELGNISQQLERSLRGTGGQKLRGKTWLMTWSSSPNDIAVEEFNKGDFEKYATGAKKVKTAHSGTVPETVFNYIDEHIIDINSRLGKINLKEKPEQDKIKPDDTYIPMTEGDPSVMPFLLFVTDAGFSSKLTSGDIRSYANNSDTLKAVWYLILDASEGDKKMCYPKNIIEYNIVKV